MIERILRGVSKRDENMIEQINQYMEDFVFPHMGEMYNDVFNRPPYYSLQEFNNKVLCLIINRDHYPDPLWVELMRQIKEKYPHQWIKCVIRFKENERQKNFAFWYHAFYSVSVPPIFGRHSKGFWHLYTGMDFNQAFHRWNQKVNGYES